MRIINHLQLQIGREQKFVIIELSNGETHFVAATAAECHGRHKYIVSAFCKEYGFHSTAIPRISTVSVIRQAEKDGVTLQVTGGAYLDVTDERIIVRDRSSDYGSADELITAQCIEDAKAKSSHFTNHEVIYNLS